MGGACLSWDNNNDNGGNTRSARGGAPPRTAASTSSSASKAGLAQKIAQAKDEAMRFHAEGDQEKFQTMVTIIAQLEAQMEDDTPSRPNPISQGDGPSPVAADPNAKAAYMDARRSANAIKNRNRNGGNPLSWD